MTYGFVSMGSDEVFSPTLFARTKPGCPPPFRTEFRIREKQKNLVACSSVSSCNWLKALSLASHYYVFLGLSGPKSSVSAGDEKFTILSFRRCLCPEMPPGNYTVFLHTHNKKKKTS